MRIDHLKYITIVAETGSISHAAERLYITQQGLSQAIRQLEKELGVPLLNRTGNKIYLTQTGKRIVEKAKELLVTYDELIDIAKTAGDNPFLKSSKRITLLTTPFLSGTLLPDIICRFTQKHPNANLVINEKLPQEIIEEIREDRNAIGLFSGLSDRLNHKDFSNANLTFQPFFECEQLICVTKSSPLANRKSVNPSELAKYPLALYDVGQNASQLCELLKPFGEVKVMLRTGNSKLYRETIASGLAIGFSNSFAEYFEKRNSVVTIPIENTPKFILGWVYCEDTPRNEMQREFIDQLIQYVNRIRISA
ncbi:MULTISPECIES: LysR family transcriptional regulator [Desulfitobacterium]|uniref:Transcriptional regulator n=1 Tax=Desulfitobacterium dehalogenans (strain ATCC 51507 / DSM 9161 / JW/IU-DC1) TaxID=756499 RepID=I4A5E0_DESDJ|nr:MULTISPECIES: LysR family transcriptional regulator [Desulfitobacterium]AFL99174.1 transcriptional regulator [Desulfitobacterium dehalogenans ATCC 51507]